MKKIVFIVAGVIVVLGVAYFVMYYFFDTDLLGYILGNQKGKADELRAKREGYAELKVFEYKYKSGVMDPETKTLVQHITFDKTGKILNEEIVLPYDKIKVLYLYDKNNNPIQRNEYDIKTGEIVTKTFYSYNRSKLQTTITYLEDSSMGVHNYDKNETEFTYIKYDRDSQILESSSNVNIYDNKNQLVEQRGLFTTFDTHRIALDTVITITTYTQQDMAYDSISIITAYTPDSIAYDSMITVTAYTSYNIARDSMINTTVYISHSIARDSIITINTYTYEKDLLMSYTTITVVQNNEPSFYVYRLSYNEKNLLVEKIKYNRSGEPVQAIVYEYN